MPRPLAQNMICQLHYLREQRSDAGIRKTLVLSYLEGVLMQAFALKQIHCSLKEKMIVQQHLKALDDEEKLIDII